MANLEDKNDEYESVRRDGASPEMPEYSSPAPDALPPDGVFLPPSPQRLILPLLLFLATCVSTYFVWDLLYAVTLMLILSVHELGHFLQARRHRVPASLPYFIPMPISVFGTFGAIIAMRSRVPNRRALFDIAVTGPLAGLVVAVAATVVGLYMSTVLPRDHLTRGIMLGEPLIFKCLGYFIFGALEEGEDIRLHPIAYAGWVGIFITALNLWPIGQLDGGHILYSLMRRKAHVIAEVLLLGATAAVLLTMALQRLGVGWGSYWFWLPMLLILSLMGPRHPPTANDQVPLGPGRVLLGWLALLFVPVGFTPAPFPFLR